MLAKVVFPIFLISCLAGCTPHQDSFSRTSGLPDTTQTQDTSQTKK